MKSATTTPAPLVVSQREAARMLGISPRTLWTLSHRGEVPFVKIGRSLRYAIADLNRYIDQSRVEKGGAQ